MMSDFDFFVFNLLGVVGSFAMITMMTCIAYFVCRTEWFADLLFGIGDSDDDD